MKKIIAFYLLLIFSEYSLAQKFSDFIPKMSFPAEVEVKYNLLKVGSGEYTTHYNVSFTFEDVEKKAQNGDVVMQSILGTWYYKGNDKTIVIPQNFEKAAFWFNQAANSGDDYSQCFLGLLYEYGQGVSQDYEKAVMWYNKAIEKNNAQAMYNLANMYRWHKGLPFDLEKSYSLIRQSAELGNCSAQYHMGFLCTYVDRFNKDYPQAVMWYNKALEQGNTDCYFDLATIYEFGGHGVKKDLFKAREYIEKSIKAGNDDQKILERIVAQMEKEGLLNKDEENLSKQGNVGRIASNVIVPMGNRIAFLIGNSKYDERTNGPTTLNSPENDVIDMKRKLEELGFKVVSRTNLNKEEMRSDIHNFCDTIKNYNVALFYYSGHAVQYKGDSKLLPVNEDFIYPADYKNNAVDLSFILEEMNNTNINTRIVILDACRNRDTGSKGYGDDEWVMPANPGCFLAFATRAGSKARDGRPGVDRNSIYTKVLLEKLGEPNPIGIVFEHVTSKVEQMTDKEQKPRHYNDLSGPYRQFYFKVNGK